MKKVMPAVLLTALCACLPVVPSAAGGVAGEYYSTDIITTLNGMEISSINTGGRTFIRAEDMLYYGFQVSWNPDARRLEINRIPHAANERPPEVERSALPVGTLLGHYYETDIITTLDGKPVQTCNTGGETYLLAEQMAELGYRVDWDGEARTLSILDPLRAGYLYSVRLTAEGDHIQEEGTGSFTVCWEDGILSGRGDTDYFSSYLYFDGVEYALSLSLYQSGGLFYSGRLLEELNALASSGYGIEHETDPAEEYGAVNSLVDIRINGRKAEQVAVSAGAGNGHRDFIFTFRDIPPCTRSELQTVYFAIGGETGGPMTPLVLPEDPLA